MADRRALVLALGRPLGGDDAVGLVVAASLEPRLPTEATLRRVADATALIEAFASCSRVVLIDAVVAADACPVPGRVHVAGPEALASRRLHGLSSHGLDVTQALGLARALAPQTAARDVVVVGIEIAAARMPAQSLSPAVAAAVEPATQAVLSLLAAAAHGAALGSGWRDG